MFDAAVIPSEVGKPRVPRSICPLSTSRDSSTALDMTKKIGLALLIGLALGGSVAAQDSSPQPSSSPAPRNIRISFVPPPLEGTISLGIYDAAGKLVRVLFREADINEFNIGNDSLSTSWDGKDDAGENVLPGKYSAHGFIVGDVKIEGIGFFFNDWVRSPEAARFSKITSLRLRGDDLLLAVELIPPGAGHVVYNIAEKTTKLQDTEADSSPPPAESAPPAAGRAVSVPGREGTRWVIEQNPNEASVELKQFSAAGEFLRRLPIGPTDPRPKAVAASIREDKIYLLEENTASQRVRALTLTETKKDGGEQAVSDWKVDFEKSIVSHKDFAVVDGKPVAVAPNTEPSEKIKVKLQPNPLLGDDRVTVELAVGVDEEGSFLKAADGLPLCSVSETPELIRGILTAHGPSTVDVFQDDGAVVEQFRLSSVDQMMSFDCGGFELN